MATSHVGPQTRTRRTSMIQRSQTRAVKLVATLKIGAGSSEDQQILGHGQYWKDGASHCLTTCRTGVEDAAVHNGRSEGPMSEGSASRFSKSLEPSEAIQRGSSRYPATPLADEETNHQ